MELTNRILEIIEKSGLTPSEFADKIEVQRSAISHLSSGRNKPSLDFLLKIKQAYPEIDTDWLLFGVEKEEEFNENTTEIKAESNPSDSYPTLFDLSVNESVDEKLLAKDEERPEYLSSNASKNKQGKKIIRTILFYEDGSFEDFMPIR